MYRELLHSPVWREANITSIYKKGNKSTAGNYRPVSLTCITCKVLESIIRDAVIDFMQTRNLFSKRQYGFMSGRSTTLQLLHVLEEWIQIVDQGGTVHCIFLDFMKAFDSVPHQRLVLKLKAYGIDGRLLTWIGRFLRNRRQEQTSGHKWVSFCLGGCHQWNPTGFCTGSTIICYIYQRSSGRHKFSSLYVRRRYQNL